MWLWSKGGTMQLLAEKAGTMQLWGSLGHTVQEAGKQDVAAMQSSLLAVWKNEGEMLREGKG